jgi:hypothetical protein
MLSVTPLHQVSHDLQELSHSCTDTPRHFSGDDRVDPVISEYSLIKLGHANLTMHIVSHGLSYVFKLSTSPYTRLRAHTS